MRPGFSFRAFRLLSVLTGQGFGETTIITEEASGHRLPHNLDRGFHPRTPIIRIGAGKSENGFYMVIAIPCLSWAGNER